MKKNNILIFIFLVTLTISVSANTMVDDAAEIEFSYIEEEIMPDGYRVSFDGLSDFTDDGIDEYWIVADKEVDGQEWSKIFVFRKIEDFSFEQLWVSQNMPGKRGYLVKSVKLGQTHYIALGTISNESQQFQLWLFNWNHGEPFLINEPLFSDRLLSFHKNHGEFKNLPLDQWLILITDIREDGNHYQAYLPKEKELVFGDEFFEKKEVEPTKVSLEEKYPELASVVQNNYPGYKLNKLCFIDNGEQFKYLYLIQLTSSSSELLWIVVENIYKEEGDVVLWYSLDQHYSPYNFLEKIDINHDGYMEIVLSDRSLMEYDLIYIISLKPERPELVTPLNEDGFTPIMQWDMGMVMEFEDVNEDGFKDLKTSTALQHYDVWLWDPALENFESTPME